MLTRLLHNEDGLAIAETALWMGVFGAFLVVAAEFTADGIADFADGLVDLAER